MKFIHTPGQRPVNLERVEYAYVNYGNNQHTISFITFAKSHVQWVYSDKSVRDEIYEKVLISMESQDISQITQIQ